MASPAAEPYGVLLYYKYCPLDAQQEDVKQFYVQLCTSLKQRGRIRVARDGVNVTVGGTLNSILEHIAALKAHHIINGNDIDFKVQESGGAQNEQMHHEAKFDTLAVKVCEELVTLGPLARNKADPFLNTATHLSPQEFHAMLQRSTAADGADSNRAGPSAGEADAGEADAGAAPGCAQASSADEQMVLLDARNIYETRIGHFTAGGVPLLVPSTRCFSDLPAWIDAHAEQLAGKTVMMYCTGGVRCERASAYLRDKGPAFQSVYQLSGGIQRYLEAFPDGGLFRGKNFVYDDRGAVGPADPGAQHPVVGECLLCGVGWDDYGSRLRCRRCRLLLLVCDGCRAARAADVKGGLLCELCTRCPAAGGVPKAASAAAADAAAAQPLEQACSGGGGQRPKCASSAQVHGDGAGAPGAAGQRRLRILCLHGFRQTAKQFQGRTCALRKRLKDVADFVFVDAPHVLPLFTKQQQQQQQQQLRPGGRSRDVGQEPDLNLSLHLDLDLDDLAVATGAADTSGPSQQPSTEGREREAQAGGEGEHEQPQPLHQRPRGQDRDREQEACRPRRAWLLPPELLVHAPLDLAEAVAQPQASAAADAAGDSGAAAAAVAAAATPADGAGAVAAAGGWQAAPEYVDERQYLRQTEGWGRSLEALRAAVAQHGPFDGVMGFSQGAAVAAVLCALQQRARKSQQQQQQQQEEPCSKPVDQPNAASSCGSLGAVDFGFRFAILASGFVSPVPEHRVLLEAEAPVQLPTLHVYGATGDDRQVGPVTSGQLADRFAPGLRRTLCHSDGHIIPSSRSRVAPFREFLLDQLLP